MAAVNLTGWEKVAARWFRERGREALEAAWASNRLDGGEPPAPCSARIRYFRHECRPERGRTRSVALEDVTLESPEILVGWERHAMRVFSAEEAAAQAAGTGAPEFEVILAGKFGFSWKYGQCAACGLRVLSREGTLADLRPRPAEQPGDLAVFSGQMQLKVDVREMLA